jgi:hypothetical protein
MRLIEVVDMVLINVATAAMIMMMIGFWHSKGLYVLTVTSAG